MRGKCHALYYDCDMNSFQTVILNIYENLLCCAARFHCHLVELTKVTKIVSDDFVKGLSLMLSPHLQDLWPPCCITFTLTHFFPMQ